MFYAPVEMHSHVAADSEVRNFDQSRPFHVQIRALAIVHFAADFEALATLAHDRMCIAPQGASYASLRLALHDRRFVRMTVSHEPGTYL